MPALEAGELILRASRLQWIALAAVCVIFALGGLYLIVTGEDRGYAVAAFFALGALLAFALLFHGRANLRLAEDGFVFGLMWREESHRWKDVSAFDVVAIRGSRRVAFDVPRDRGALAGMARKQIGFSAILPDRYGMKAEDLAAIMNQWREAALEPGRSS